MTTTANLGLTTYDVASGSLTTFQTFRTAIAGTSSNMSIIDTFAGSTSASIISLTANEIIDVNASQISANYYEATVSLISSYATNLKVNLKTNATCTGAVTININGLGTKTLKKVDATGTLIDLASGDIVSGAYSLWIYNGTYFVLIGSLVTSGSSSSGSGITYVGVSPITVTGSNISHATSGVTAGSYVSANVIVDAFGHITGIASGMSASSIGAPSDSPFLTTGSSASLTNYKILASGSNINFVTTGSSVFINNSINTYVVPSGSATVDNAIARYDGTTGSKIQNSLVTIDDSGNIINYNEKCNTISGSGTKDIDWSTGNIFEVTMSGSVTFTFSQLVAGKSVTLVLIQDGYGSHIATWPSMKWPGGNSPTLTTTGSAVDVVTLFVRSNGTTVYGFSAGLDIK